MFYCLIIHWSDCEALQDGLPMDINAVPQTSLDSNLVGLQHRYPAAQIVEQRQVAIFDSQRHEVMVDGLTMPEHQAVGAWWRRADHQAELVRWKHTEKQSWRVKLPRNRLCNSVQ